MAFFTRRAREDGGRVDRRLLSGTRVVLVALEGASPLAEESLYMAEPVRKRVTVHSRSVACGGEGEADRPLLLPGGMGEKEDGDKEEEEDWRRKRTRSTPALRAVQA